MRLRDFRGRIIFYLGMGFVTLHQKKNNQNHKGMEVKKSPKASLENKRLLLTEIGLVIALGIVYFAFNFSSREKSVAVLEDTTQVLVEEEMIAIQNETPPPPPEAPRQPAADGK